MNGRDTHETPAMAATNFSARWALEVAGQLERDATSLTLTGESFAKDKHFYDKVAATIREGAALLKQWQPLLEQFAAASTAQEDRARVHAFERAGAIARGVADLVPQRPGGAATTWRICGLAIESAIETVRLDQARFPEVDTRALGGALKRGPVRT